jgi:isoleucyl-tRNA synthetase
MDNYDITKAVRKLQAFVIDDLSNWYVRLSRSRFWTGEMDEDKKAAYSTLYEVLETTVRTIAPYAPFLSEAIYGRLREASGGETPESVHLSDFPEADAGAIDSDLESAMDLARTVVALGRSARSGAGIKVRQPLSRILVAGVPPARKAGLEALRALVLSELNVKAMEWAEADDLATLRAEPVFPKLGPKHGKRVNQVAEAIRSLDSEEVGALAAGGEVTVNVTDESATVAREDVRIVAAAKAGLAVAAEGGLTVAFDTTLTEELLDEGFAREMINKIQFMRKEAGFEVVDRILVHYEAGPRLKLAVDRHAGRIASETLAEKITEGTEAGEFKRAWDINGETATIAVERVGRQGSGGTGSVGGGVR